MSLVPVLLSYTSSLKKSEKGATAVEYGLMVALIALVIIGAVILLGTNLNTTFGSIAGKV
jgi:pilus assembly protein Flp/PilA